jgi:hypothetical protein
LSSVLPRLNYAAFLLLHSQLLFEFDVS